MIKRGIVVLLSMTIFYGSTIKAMQDVHASSSKKRLALCASGTVLMLNEKLNSSTELRKSSAIPIAETRHVLRSSTEVFEEAMVRNYAHFPHSSYSPTTMENSLSSSGKIGFSESFYDFP